MIFDTHAHYDDDRFIFDRELLLGGELEAGGIGKVMNVAADIDSLDSTNDLSLRYNNVYAALGIHPSELKGMDERVMDHIRRLAKSNKKVKAIGEIGFDYHDEEYDRNEQEKWFIRQIKLADELMLPIIVHSRGAAADTMRVIKDQYKGREDQINGVVHCYSYSAEDAKEYVRSGFMIGVGGVVTFKNGKKLKEVVSCIPLKSIVLETDAPYLAPEPYRGDRNTSLNLKYVVECVSEIKGISVKEAEDTTFENAMRLYRL
ncbi:MAG: TatD family hydrolase [Lachnospiraceae bacterium]|nr:TatD family hydrolase [Lachnospiraceae bacterium]